MQSLKSKAPDRQFVLELNDSADEAREFTECPSCEVLVHCTVSPTWILIVDGEKYRAGIVTDRTTGEAKTGAAISNRTAAAQAIRTSLIHPPPCLTILEL